jgi:arylsulfatase A-like enzyme
MSLARVASGLLLTLLVASSGCTALKSDPPNIVLIVLDTVRADRFSCRADGPVPMPRIAALCKRGVFFERVSSTSSWTLPSHASIFTGLYPVRHGATQEHTLLDETAPTLAELLGANGYRTFGVSANPVVGIKSGLARGFDSFDETWRGRHRPGPAKGRKHPNLRAIDQLLEVRDQTLPFFLFVNFIEAHAPNAPPPRFIPAAASGRANAGRRVLIRLHDAESYYLDPQSISSADLALLSDLYDGEIAHLDALVGQLVDRLEADGALANSVLIVTSDHGENFGDHGHFRHVFSLYGSTVRVPLLVVLPDGAHAGERRSEPVALVDLFATILGAAGVPTPADVALSRDLFAADAEDAGRPVVAEYYYPAQALTLFGDDATEVHRDRLGRYLRRLRSIESNGLRYIWSSDGRHELYDVAADPAEEHDLAGDPRFAARERELRERLEAFVASASEPARRPGVVTPAGEGAFEGLDPESAERLRELGYVRE